MAYSAFRGPTSPREEHSLQTSYPTNTLSPPRNSNRTSSGGMMSSAAEQRVGLQRRFTTNALPILSPIGQQRLQAAGDVKPVSTISTSIKRRKSRQNSCLGWQRLHTCLSSTSVCPRCLTGRCKRVGHEHIRSRYHANTGLGQVSFRQHTSGTPSVAVSSCAQVRA